MSKLIDAPLTVQEYDELAEAYRQTLPMEHFMEAPPQATQRKIFLESFDLVHARRPEVQVYSELLVQYRVGGKLRRVVPDNLVCLNESLIVAKASYNPELEPVAPLWVLEWVSSSSEGKDYGDAFRKYERDLKVPYCLQFNPEEQDFRFYRHGGRKYRPVPAARNGRYPLPELEVEVGLLDGWVRFWFRRKLLPLPADIQRENDELRRQSAELRRQVDQEKAKRLALEEEVAKLKAARANGKRSPNGQGG